MNFIKRQPPGRLIAAGFALVILAGAALLMLPVSVRDGAQVTPIDALFTSTSAVCVTGLIAIDTADHFTVFGRTIVALLIQVGGLGVTSVGVGFILVAGKRVGFKSRLLVREAMNMENGKGIVRLVKSILLMTLCFEGAGALLSFLVFVQDYPPLRAAGINNLLLNLTTAGLIIFGGLGFLVILDILKKRSFRALALHSKVVIVMSAVLILLGTLLLKATENVTWLGAFFQSVSARTAGFSTYPIGSFTDAGLSVFILLMFVGASPGSTGGGINTTTLFALLQATRSAATGRMPTAFRRTVAGEVVQKAFIVTLLSAFVVCGGTFILCLLEPDLTFLQLLFEATSAFGTVGLSTGITPQLQPASKLIVILIMYTGRIGPLTVASLWAFRTEQHVWYSEETITIG